MKSRLRIRKVSPYAIRTPVFFFCKIGPLLYGTELDITNETTKKVISIRIEGSNVCIFKYPEEAVGQLLTIRANHISTGVLGLVGIPLEKDGTIIALNQEEEVS